MGSGGEPASSLCCLYVKPERHLDVHSCALQALLHRFKSVPLVLQGAEGGLHFVLCGK